MNIEFHYYILHYLCNQAGFSEEESRAIAWSSQFVDNCIISYVIETKRGRYQITPTQNYGFWNEGFPREVYIPFHFYPGDPDYPGAARADAKKNRLNCTPHSRNVKELLIRGLKTRNLYRVGIALHAYADSFAHQNFSGVLEEWNITESRSLIPAIGHAQALKAPDELTERWTDSRLIKENREISNRERFTDAARMIYKYLCTYNQRSFEDADLVVDRLEDLWGPAGNERPPAERIYDLIIDQDILKYDRTLWLREAFRYNDVSEDENLFTGYSKLLWLKDAILHRSSLMAKKPLKAKEGFYKTALFHWHEAAQAHRQEALEIIRELV